MKYGKQGMGMSKHRKSGFSTKSPRARFLEKIEAEKNERKDNTRIKNPKGSVKELFSR